MFASTCRIGVPLSDSNRAKTRAPCRTFVSSSCWYLKPMMSLVANQCWNHTGFQNNKTIELISNIYVYMVSCSVFLPPAQWYGSPGSTPFHSIAKPLAAFLRSSLVFARSLQHFWLPASPLLGTCYLLDDLRTTHTPSKYLRASCSHKYMCYVCTSYLLHIYIYAYKYIYICI